MMKEKKNEQFLFRVNGRLYILGIYLRKYPLLYHAIKDMCRLLIPGMTYDLKPTMKAIKYYRDTGEYMEVDEKRKKCVSLPCFWDVCVLNILKDNEKQTEIMSNIDQEKKLKEYFLSDEKKNENGYNLFTETMLGQYDLLSPLSLTNIVSDNRKRIERVTKTENFNFEEDQNDTRIVKKLYPYQLEIIKKAHSYLEIYGGTTIVCQPGRGKTLMAAHMIRQLILLNNKNTSSSSSNGQEIKKKRVMIGVHKEELGGNWLKVLKRELLPFTDLVKENEIIFYTSKKTKTKLEDVVKNHIIVIIMIQTLIRRPHELFTDNFDLFIVDECHHIAAETLSLATEKVNGETIGLTGTPERLDEQTEYIYWSLGPCCHYELPYYYLPVTLNIINFSKHSAPSNPLYAFTKNDTGNYDDEEEDRATNSNASLLKHSSSKKRKFDTNSMNCGGNWLSKLNHVDMQNYIANDSVRNLTIVNVIQQLLMLPEHKHRKVIIFCNLNIHAEILHKLFGGDEHAQIYTGESKKKTKSSSSSSIFELKKNILITTYHQLGEGVDCPEIDTIVLAGPKPTITQPCARGLRDDPNNPDKKVIIYDFIDHTWHRCVTNAKKRLEDYFQKCFDDISINQNYTTIVYNDEVNEKNIQLLKKHKNHLFSSSFQEANCTNNK